MVNMNKKSITERAQILRCLVEGNSIRSTVRLTGASKNTIVKLLAATGTACDAYQDEHLANLTKCERIQVDEIWSFVYSKQKNIPDGKWPEAGDIWTWVAICADTKLVVSWRVGRRTRTMCNDFAEDLATRLPNRVQLTSDGHGPYREAVREAFNGEVDHAMLVKLYGAAVEAQRRYSPAHYVGAKKTVVTGEPDTRYISTSYAERQNLTMRMGMRRFTRLTNAFSKKIENHAHAVALHFMYYNFCRVHKTLGTTPAVAAGVSDKPWTLEDVVRMIAAYEESDETS